MSVGAQKDVAEEVLDQLFSIDPFAIVAGGAPRDWYFNQPARDIDVFFHVAERTQITMIEHMLAHVGFAINRTNDGHHLPDIYKKNPKLRCVFNAKAQEVDVQLMCMSEPTFKCVLQEFPLSICKAWYKNGRCHYEKDFLRSVKHNVIVKTSEIYADEDAYIKKVCDKFSRFNYYSSWNECAIGLLDKG